MKRIKQNSLWAIAGGGVPALVALIAIPVLVHHLGYEIFAITSLIISLTIFFYIYDFGIGRSLTYYASKHENIAGISIHELVGSGVLVSLILSSIVTMIVYVASPYLVNKWISVGKEFTDSSSLAFQVASLGIVPSVIGNAFKGILEGQSRFKEANICKIFSGATIFLVPLVLVLVGNSNVVDMSIGIVLSRYVALAVYSIILRDSINLKFINIKVYALKAILRYGFWIAISSLIATMFVYGDRFVVAHYLKAEDLSIYVASQDVLIRYLLIPWSMAIVLMPIFSSGIVAQVDTQNLYNKIKRQTVLFSLMFLFIAMIVASVLIPIFSSYQLPVMLSEVILIQAIGIFFCALSQLPLIYLYANGGARLITLIYVFEGFLYLFLTPWIFEQYHLVGACIVWTSRLIIEFALLRFFAERHLYANQ